MRVNPFDYLHYKIYRAWRQFDGRGFLHGHHMAICVLYLLNSMTIYYLLFREFPSKEFTVITFILINVPIHILYTPKREKRILLKYKKESEKSRHKGNVAVILYAVVTIISFALVMRSPS